MSNTPLTDAAEYIIPRCTLGDIHAVSADFSRGLELELNELKAKVTESQWQPFDTAPQDGTTIEGWHIIHLCPVAIRCVPEFSAECPWIEKTYCNRWPTESFSNWRPLSVGPEEKK